MFGPLNGVRSALVATAVVSAIIAFALGWTIAGVVILTGVAVHGLGWWWLYQRHRPSAPDHPIDPNPAS